MSTFLGPVLSYILLYKYPVLFLVQFLAALIVPFPANTTLVAVGAFVGQGYMGLTASFLIALAGNVAGDNAGYWIARRLERRISRWVKSSSRSATLLRRLDSAIREYAGFTVFVTRFTPALQIVVNFMSGLAEVPPWRFLFWDILGDAGNVAIYMAAGYFIGSDWQNIIGIFGLAGGILVVLVLIAATFIVYRTISRNSFEK